MNSEKYTPALKEAKQYGIDFTLDFFQQGGFEVDYVCELAKKYGYRKPRNANGSTGRYFYSLLQKVNRVQ